MTRPAELAQSAAEPSTAGRAGGVPEVVRSEERLRAGVETVVTGRARLRTYVVTETRTLTVEVRRQLATLEIEGAAADSAQAAAPGYQPAAGEQAFVLYEEEPVVTLQTRPYAQARLITELSTEQVPVSADVRVERVSADSDGRSLDGPVEPELR